MGLATLPFVDSVGYLPRDLTRLKLLLDKLDAFVLNFVQMKDKRKPHGILALKNAKQ